MSRSTTGRPSADRVRAAIRASGRSQRQVAAEMGMDETKLSKSLSGQRRFTDDEFVTLARVTGVPVGELLEQGPGEAPVSVAPPETDPSGASPSTPEQARRRLEIIESAWRLFARTGFEAVRVSDIAAAAGVSSATVHYYFPAKPDLFAMALSHSVKLAYDRQVARLTGVQDPVERLWRLLEMQSPHGEAGRLDWSIWLQSWNRVALAGGRDEEYVEIYRRWFETVRSAIDAGQRAGTFQPGLSEDLTGELTAFVDGLGVQVLTGVLSEEDMERRLREHLRRRILQPDVDLPIERPVPSSQGSPPAVEA
ncbi:TetR family transcriptional regulator C-terminal domain-containing protein [Nesterenkonia sp. HG001]|uniref:TetR family transcriptional regulator C-terminal domain-containing protein n=1 Tax=Nesterenkonia sp. HG001 TaxID=2983207 RepID=UPI002AC7BAB8|nr:TetR family transcriptional regulator [Nesterenkonia sp. HG001]MDZ5077578.1 TetR family transcriptional regulator [Nesterenkonia sp. HG001]